MSHGGDIYTNKVNMDFSVNLNPFVKEVWGDAVDEAVKSASRRALERAGSYPDLNEKRLRKAIAKADGVKSENVYPGNGASEILLAAIRSLSPKNVLLPVPCFTGYGHAINGIKDCKIVNYPLKEENGYAVDEELIHYIERSGNEFDLLILTDPTSPAGRNIGDDLLLKILDAAKEKSIKVILDESFYLLSESALKERSVIEIINKYDDLIIVRSYTKLFALPGLRMGYVLADKKRIEMIRDQLPEWNLSVVSEEIMIALSELIDEDKIKRAVEKIRAEREFLSEGLKKRDIKIYPSDAVYITYKAKEDLYDKMIEKGILIRDCSDFEGLRKGVFRVAVKGRKENEEFLTILDEVI